MKHELCRIADVPSEGSAIVPSLRRAVRGSRTSGRLRAAVNVCLHVAGPLACRDGRPVCRWHGASVDMTRGERIDGPAPAGSRLMFLSTQEADGSLRHVRGETA